jgi:ATP-binding cassette subfamily B protein
MTQRRPRRRLLAPEVVQTSAMDCGPAALTSLLAGHGISVSYARLRDACQTDVDGTSIDTLETVANDLGLLAEQIVIPVDHVLRDEAAALPAIAVVELAERLTHFVVVWRRHGRWVQVMDPASGRRWTTTDQLGRELYVHQMPVAAADWRAWAESEEATRALEARLRDVGFPAAPARAAVADALSDPTWQAVAALDAATRLTASLLAARGLARGRDTVALCTRLVDAVRSDPARRRLIPDRYWSVTPTEDARTVTLRGAVLVRVRDRRAGTDTAPDGAAASPVAAALDDRPARPLRDMLALLRPSVGWWAAVGLVTVAGAVGLVVEAALFRALLNVSGELATYQQRLAALAAVVVLAVMLTLLDVPLMGWLLAAGRRLDTRLRERFFTVVPTLEDRYFHSRLTSDLAERVHSLHVVRQAPLLAGRSARVVAELVATTIGIAWLDPGSAALAILLLVVVVAVPLIVHPVLTELELRLRTHGGALTRYYLDALLGLVPLRVHGAERALRREHERVVGEWTDAGRRLVAASVIVDAVQTSAGFGLAGWLLWRHLAGGGEATALLLLYWTLRLPVLGDELAFLVRQYPMMRNIVLRLLETLHAAGPHASGLAPTPALPGATATPDLRGVGVVFDDVAVRVGGHPVLEHVSLAIAPGEHVAVVGASGAGKSTFVGLLLGWHVAASGRLLADGAPLDHPRLEALRRQTAWVDPAVQLWNQSLLDNLCYGHDAATRSAAGWAVGAAALEDLVRRLPDGLQTTLGEGGGLVSGGEGQRVRLGRALLGRDVRLAVLDEPFRGLDPERRRVLMEHARRHWRAATLLCVTHDIAEAAQFDRVLVVHDGRVVEDGRPADLAAGPTRFAALARAQAVMRERLWVGPGWRRVRLHDGRLIDERTAARA